MAVREGRWDCQYCGTKGNIGRNKSCQNCGRSRPAGTKFYLPSEEQVAILDANLLELAKAGQDWVCEFCGSSNHPDVTICHSCGSPREGTSPVQEVKEYELGETPDSGDMTFDEAAERPQTLPAPQKKSSRTPLIIGGLVVGLLVICGLIFAGFLLFGGQDIDASVTGFEWDRAVDIEAYQTVVEEDWTVPTGGRTLDQRRDIRRYEQVLDHYETRQREVQVQVGVNTTVCGRRDLGNGFFEDIECSDPVYETQMESYEEAVYRDEPVYDTLYRYEIDKWNVVRAQSESGRDHNPAWPLLNLGEDERQGEQRESYMVFFVSDDEEYTLELPLSEWQNYELGQGVTLKLDAFGNLDEVEP